MITHRGRVLFTIAWVMLGTAAGLGAVPSSLRDQVGTDDRMDGVDIGTGFDRPVIRADSERPIGNPLWAIPLKDLTATRERPIFSPSRRPPQPAVVAAPYVPPRPPAEPERPQLALVGTVASEQEGLGIFLDQSTNKTIRLKLGEDHRGWQLSKVIGREVVLQKGAQTVTLALPPPGSKLSGGSAPLPQESNDRRDRR